MKSRQGVVVGTMGFASAVIVGCLIGYHLVKSGKAIRVQQKIKSLMMSSKDSFELMSEEVILKKAQLSGDPSINQEWVEKQWESII